MVSYVQYQKKLMIQSWEKLVTDGQTDESDFIVRCPTNVERPKTKTAAINFEQIIAYRISSFYRGPNQQAKKV